MATVLQAAIDALQAEVDSFGLGTPAAPDGSIPTLEYFRSRALVVGLTYLKRCQQLGYADSLKQCEIMARAHDKIMKVADASRPTV